MEQAIAAAATGPVRSAIGILRLSGEGCVEAVEQVFFPADGAPLTGHRPHTLVLGRLTDGAGRTLDHALATFSRAPHSYTGEDAAELHCHGSPAVLALALDSLMACGVRMAQPGEFTRRAFLNGKLDLAQAEGVADLIDARTPAAVRCAADQLSGALSRQIDALYDRLLDLTAHFHATVDYPDEDLEHFDAATVSAALTAALADLDRLTDGYDRGRLLTQGVPCAIVGRPNAGKSSLLNALVGYDRAIVTDIPGTTRDTVEVLCDVGGVLLRLTDTAGLRPTDDPVERLGVERTRAALDQCRLALVVLDGAQPLTEEDHHVLRLAAQAPCALCIVNKSDLPVAFSAQALPLPALRISARTGQGLDELRRAVADLFPVPEPDQVFLTNARQFSAAQAAREALERARAALTRGAVLDLPLLDVEEALGALADLTGRQVRSDVVDRVFSRFCLGK